MEQYLFRKYDSSYHIIKVHDWPPPHDRFVRQWKFQFSRSSDITDHLNDGFHTHGIEEGARKWKLLGDVKPRILRIIIKELFNWKNR